MKIQSLSPRIDIPIINNYYLYSNYGDYTINIYYKDEHSCYIVVRRHDETNGWGFLEIIIDSIDKNIQENFELGSSKTSVRIIDIDNAKITFIPVTYIDQKIPKVIIQTAETDEFTDFTNINAIMSIMESNPEYKYIFMDSIKRRQFINENCDTNILLAYDTLVSEECQTDLFIYCYLYIKGGCYIDYKMIERKPLRESIKQDDSLLICIDYEYTNTLDKKIGTGYLNSIIISEPGNVLFLNMIQMCIINIMYNQYLYYNEINCGGYSLIFDITGSTIFYKALYNNISDDNLCFKHIIENNNEKKIYDLNRNQIIFSKTNKTSLHINNLSDLWSKKELFYCNYKNLGNWSIFVYPHPFNDIFDFCIIKSNQLLIIRNEGCWFLELKLKMVNNITSQIIHINVGKNYTQHKCIEFTKDIF